MLVAAASERPRSAIRLPVHPDRRSTTAFSRPPSTETGTRHQRTVAHPTPCVRARPTADDSPHVRLPRGDLQPGGVRHRNTGRPTSQRTAGMSPRLRHRTAGKKRRGCRRTAIRPVASRIRVTLYQRRRADHQRCAIATAPHAEAEGRKVGEHSLQVQELPAWLGSRRGAWKRSRSSSFITVLFSVGQIAIGLIGHTDVARSGRGSPAILLIWRRLRGAHVSRRRGPAPGFASLACSDRHAADTPPTESESTNRPALARDAEQPALEPLDLVVGPFA